MLGKGSIQVCFYKHGYFFGGFDNQLMVRTVLKSTIKRLSPLISPFKILTYLVADHQTLNVFDQIPKRLAFITDSGVTVHAVMTTPLIVTIK